MKHKKNFRIIHISRVQITGINGKFPERNVGICYCVQLPRIYIRICLVHNLRSCFFDSVRRFLIFLLSSFWDTIMMYNEIKVKTLRDSWKIWSTRMHSSIMRRTACFNGHFYQAGGGCSVGYPGRGRHPPEPRCRHLPDPEADTLPGPRGRHPQDPEADTTPQ